MVLVVRAIHTFVAEHGDELEFQAGDDIVVLEKDEAFGDGWWRGRNPRGEEGLFPATYIQESSPVVESTPAAAAPAAVEDTPVTIPPAPVAAAVHSSTPPADVIPPDSSSPAQSLTIPPVAEKDVVAPVHTTTAPAATVPVPAGKTADTSNPQIASTMGDLDKAIGSMGNTQLEDDGELGIGQGTRARLAAQAKLANEQRDRSSSGGAVAGLVYSDESEDEDEDYPPSFNNKSLTNGGSPRNGVATTTTAADKRVVSGSAIPTSRSGPTEPLRTPVETESSSLQPALPLPATPPLWSGTSSQNQGSAQSWSVDQVVAWATSKGFDESICSKFREHEISGDLLLELDANLLKELDIPQFGKRLRIAQAITELRRPNSLSSPQEATRGMSAPPTAAAYQSSPTPPLATPTSESGVPGGWPQSRRTSSNAQGGSTPMEAIHEGQLPSNNGYPQQQQNPSAIPAYAPISLPTSPTTPSTATSAGTTKRESSGSLGHKRGKPSVDNKDRIGFFNRTRKPAPASNSPGDSWSSRLVSTGKVHQMQPASPKHTRSASGTVPGTALALQQIGTPDHSGYMKKKGERYATWKTRFFVLKGAHLYYMKNEQEDRIKGSIDLRGLRVIVDENTNPGAYGFRLVGGEKPHAFSSSEQSEVRAWMKALMKATIARDYNVPVTSSCNIPTIPLAEAQAMAPRPPSPNSRAAAQRANRRENTTQLTAHDASVLMSLDTTRRASQNLTPSRPSRDTRRPSNASNSAPPTAVTDSNSTPRPLSNPMVAAAPVPVPAPAAASSPVDESREQGLIQWVNQRLPADSPKATSISSFSSGEIIFNLVRLRSGIDPHPPVTAQTFAPEGGLPGVSGLFAMMDMLIDAGVDNVDVNLNEVRSGDRGAICRLLESVKSWVETGPGLAS